MVELPDQADVRLICLDLDGTLLDDQKRIPEAAKHSVKKALDSGIRISIASGRSYRGVLPVLKELPEGVSAVFMGGSAIYDDGRLIQTWPLSAQQLAELTDLAESRNIQMFMTNLECNLACGPLNEELKEKVRDHRLVSGAYRFFDSGEELKKATQNSGVCKFAMQCRTQEEFDGLLSWFENRNDYHAVKADELFLDVTADGITKASGVGHLASYLDIPMERVMSVGNDLNDLPMIEASGIGAAVANAEPEVLQKADVVTSSNNENGVGRLIDAVLERQNARKAKEREK